MAISGRMREVGQEKKEGNQAIKQMMDVCEVEQGGSIEGGRNWLQFQFQDGADNIQRLLEFERELVINDDSKVLI